MKVDDDSYINLRRLSEYVTIIDKRCSQKCIVGHVLGPNSPVSRTKFVQGEVHEEFVGKWVVPSYIYSQETFPNAVSGSGYIISQDMISCIFKSGTLLLTSNVFALRMTFFVNRKDLTYGLGEKEARRPTPKWNTRFYLAFSIRA